MIATRVVNLKYEEYDVYCGRGSKWGNPFLMENNTIKERNRVCDAYEKWFWTTDLPNHLDELKNKRLGCYCKPLRCHCDFLVRLIEEKEKRNDTASKSNSHK